MEIGTTDEPLGLDEVEHVKNLDSALNIKDIGRLASVFFNLHRGLKNKELGDLSEKAAFALLKRHFADDPRLRSQSYGDGDSKVEYVLVKALTEVKSFLMPIIPVVCSDTEKVSLSFHDTALYWARKFVENGLADANFRPDGLYVHPERFLGKAFRKVALRAIQYAESRNLPGLQETALSHLKKIFPPKEAVERDFRDARVLVIAPRDAYSDRDSDKAVDLSIMRSTPYELRVTKQLPPECFIVTNIYHPYQARLECGAAGIGAPAADELKPIYDKYNIDTQIGVRLS